jgi:hypothetical protein
MDERDSIQHLVEMWNTDPAACILFGVVMIVGLLAIIWIVHQYHESQRE